MSDDRRPKTAKDGCFPLLLCNILLLIPKVIKRTYVRPTIPINLQNS